MTRLRLNSVGVTLGGLLTLQGLTYVLTGNQTVNYPNMRVALGLNAPLPALLGAERRGARGISAGCAVMGYTHIGRDVIATGSDRRASALPG